MFGVSTAYAIDKIERSFAFVQKLMLYTAT